MQLHCSKKLHLYKCVGSVYLLFGFCLRCFKDFLSVVKCFWILPILKGPVRKLTFFNPSFIYFFLIQEDEEGYNDGEVDDDEDEEEPGMAAIQFLLEIIIIIIFFKSQIPFYKKQASVCILAPLIVSQLPK